MKEAFLLILNGQHIYAGCALAFSEWSYWRRRQRGYVTYGPADESELNEGTVLGGCRRNSTLGWLRCQSSGTISNVDPASFNRVSGNLSPSAKATISSNFFLISRS